MRNEGEPRRLGEDILRVYRKGAQIVGVCALFGLSLYVGGRIIDPDHDARVAVYMAAKADDLEKTERVDLIEIAGTNGVTVRKRMPYGWDLTEDAVIRAGIRRIAMDGCDTGSVHILEKGTPYGSPYDVPDIIMTKVNCR